MNENFSLKITLNVESNSLNDLSQLCLDLYEKNLQKTYGSLTISAEPPDKGSSNESSKPKEQSQHASLNIRNTPSSRIDLPSPVGMPTLGMSPDLASEDSQHSWASTPIKSRTATSFSQRNLTSPLVFERRMQISEDINSPGPSKRRRHSPDCVTEVGKKIMSSVEEEPDKVQNIAELIADSINKELLGDAPQNREIDSDVQSMFNFQLPEKTIDLLVDDFLDLLDEPKPTKSNRKKRKRLVRSPDSDLTVIHELPHTDARWKEFFYSSKCSHTKEPYKPISLEEAYPNVFKTYPVKTMKLRERNEQEAKSNAEKEATLLDSLLKATLERQAINNISPLKDDVPIVETIHQPIEAQRSTFQRFSPYKRGLLSVVNLPQINIEAEPIVCEGINCKAMCRKCLRSASGRRKSREELNRYYALDEDSRPRKPSIPKVRSRGRIKHNTPEMFFLKCNESLVPGTSLGALFVENAPEQTTIIPEVAPQFPSKGSFVSMSGNAPNYRTILPKTSDTNSDIASKAAPTLSMSSLVLSQPSVLTTTTSLTHIVASQPSDSTTSMSSLSHLFLSQPSDSTTATSSLSHLVLSQTSDSIATTISNNKNIGQQPLSVVSTFSLESDNNVSLDSTICSKSMVESTISIKEVKSSPKENDKVMTSNVNTRTHRQRKITELMTNSTLPLHSLKSSLAPIETQINNNPETLGKSNEPLTYTSFSASSDCSKELNEPSDGEDDNSKSPIIGDASRYEIVRNDLEMSDDSNMESAIPPESSNSLHSHTHLDVNSRSFLKFSSESTYEKLQSILKSKQQRSPFKKWKTDIIEKEQMKNFSNCQLKERSSLHPTLCVPDTSTTVGISQRTPKETSMPRHNPYNIPSHVVFKTPLKIAPKGRKTMSKESDDIHTSLHSNEKEAFVDTLNLRCTHPPKSQQKLKKLKKEKVLAMLHGT